MARIPFIAAACSGIAPPSSPTETESYASFARLCTSARRTVQLPIAPSAATNGPVTWREVGPVLMMRCARCHAESDDPTANWCKDCERLYDKWSRRYSSDIVWQARTIDGGQACLLLHIEQVEQFRRGVVKVRRERVLAEEDHVRGRGAAFRLQAGQDAGVVGLDAATGEAVIADLRRRGHDVTYVTRRQWEGGDDPAIEGLRVVAVAPGGPLYTEDDAKAIHAVGYNRLGQPVATPSGAVLAALVLWAAATMGLAMFAWFEPRRGRRLTSAWSAR